MQMAIKGIRYRQWKIVASAFFFSGLSHVGTHTHTASCLPHALVACITQSLLELEVDLIPSPQTNVVLGNPRDNRYSLVCCTARLSRGAAPSCGSPILLGTRPSTAIHSLCVPPPLSYLSPDHMSVDVDDDIGSGISCSDLVCSCRAGGCSGGQASVQPAMHSATIHPLVRHSALRMPSIISSTPQLQACRHRPASLPSTPFPHPHTADGSPPRGLC